MSNVPPPPPPKPNSQDASRHGTPHPPLNPSLTQPERPRSAYQQHDSPAATTRQQDVVPDPGPDWLPQTLQDKSKQDLAHLLESPDLLNAIATATSTAHASTPSSRAPLQVNLNQNIDLATHLLSLESQLQTLRSQTQTQLLAAHALERQWRTKQSDMDRALSPFAPASLYQRLSQGCVEQEGVCKALEESFVEGDGEMGTKEVEAWVRNYREARKIGYEREERKRRWDEGRVGGWR